MAYCRNCGAPVDDNSAYCPNCGAPQNAGSQYQSPQNQRPPVVDNGGFGWGLLGFCVPLVGLILFLVWKDNKPRTAKSAGKGALINVIVGVVLYALIFVLSLVSSLSY